ncbi:MAG: class I SAM-dependent methyltransferase [Actinomycetota bacterium]|nr:class I SAM-dependent methyltransferase [Actinomycetota bacterium]
MSPDKSASTPVATRNEPFWSSYQPGFRFAHHPPGTREFFDEVTAQRYELEPHIPLVVRFHRWAGCDVLEAGCGIGTDGAQFAAAAAHYTGLDVTPGALALARRRFELEGARGHFVNGSVTELPFPDDRFDLVFSHGVIHHVHGTEAALREFHRVLRPGGTLLVMVYNRRSLNYYFTILLVRRLFVGLLLLPRAAALVSKITGEPEEILEGHRELLREHGLRYIFERQLFLSNNTDGPGNPLSKVYSRRELTNLLPRGFSRIHTDVRYLNTRLYPGGDRLARSRLGKRLERLVGWHLYLEATKQLL